MKPSTSRALAKVVAITKGRGYEAPHAALLITNALRAVLQETASLQNAAGLMYTLWAPYGGAVGFLGEAARPYHNAEDRWKLIREAQDWFKNARAYAPDQFCKALAEWQLGNSCVLLGDKEEAKDWYQRAHTSAIGYLHDRERAVTAPQDRYAKYANYIPDEVLTAAQAIPEPSLSQAVVFARSAKLGLKSWYAYATEKNRKQFVEKEAPPVLDLIDALEELQRQAPALDLKFYESSPPSSPGYSSAASSPSTGSIEETSPSSVIQTIRELAKLKEEGVISDDEFVAKKKALLDRL